MFFKEWDKLWFFYLYSGILVNKKIEKFLKYVRLWMHLKSLCWVKEVIHKRCDSIIITFLKSQFYGYTEAISDNQELWAIRGCDLKDIVVQGRYFGGWYVPLIMMVLTWICTCNKMQRTINHKGEKSILLQGHF